MTFSSIQPLWLFKLHLKSRNPAKWEADFLFLCNVLYSIILDFYWQEAIAAESFLDSTPLCIEKGDLKAGFDESDHLLEGEMRVGGQVGQALNSIWVDELGNWYHQRLVGWRRENTGRSREVPWEPCERKQTLQRPPRCWTHWLEINLA